MIDDHLLDTEFQSLIGGTAEAFDSISLDALPKYSKEVMTEIRKVTYLERGIFLKEGLSAIMQLIQSKEFAPFLLAE